MPASPSRTAPAGRAGAGGTSPMTRRLGKLLAWPFLALLLLYRWTLSPFLGINCRFQPTCSEYAREALRTYGLPRGAWLAARRIARCHPWGPSGYDPLPHPTDRDRF